MKAIGCDVYNFDTTGNIACCLTANSGTPNTAGPKIIILNDQGGSVMNVSDKSMTLRAEEHGHQPVVCMPMTFQGKAGSEASLCIGEDIACTLRPAIEADVVYSFEPGIMRRDCSAGNRAYKNICSTLRAQMGDNQPAVCYGVVSKGNGEAFLSPERHMSLSIGGGQAGQGYPAVCYKKENYSE